VKELKARVATAEQTVGSAKYNMTHPPNWTTDEAHKKSQHQVNGIVSEIVRHMLVKSGEELLTGQAIYDGVLTHPRLVALRVEQQEQAAHTKTDAENAMVVDRLAGAIAMLKTTRPRASTGSTGQRRYLTPSSTHTGKHLQATNQARRYGLLRSRL
jgi:hypothetical protein